MRMNHIEENVITPGVYGVNSGGAHSSGTLMNRSKSSNMLTAKIWALSSLYPWVFSLASSASYKYDQTWNSINNVINQLCSHIFSKYLLTENKKIKHCVGHKRDLK